MVTPFTVFFSGRIWAHPSKRLQDLGNSFLALISGKWGYTILWDICWYLRQKIGQENGHSLIGAKFSIRTQGPKGIYKDMRITSKGESPWIWGSRSGNGLVTGETWRFFFPPKGKPKVFFSVLLIFLNTTTCFLASNIRSFLSHWQFY